MPSRVPFGPKMGPLPRRPARPIRLGANPVHPNLIFIEGWEAGVIPDSLSQAGTDLAVAKPGAQMSISPLIVRRPGSYSLKWLGDGASAVAVWQKQFPAGVDVAVHRFAFCALAWPSALVVIHDSTTSTNCMIQLNTSGQIFGTIGANNTSLIQLSLGRWHVIEWIGDVSSGTWRIALSVDGGNAVRATAVFPADVFVTTRLGPNGNALTGEMYFDDWVCSATAVDFPIGDGSVYRLDPDPAGATAISTALRFQDEAAAALAAGTALNHLDATAPWQNVRGPSAKYIDQIATDLAAYVEMDMLDTVATTFNGVAVTLAATGSTGNTSNGPSSRAVRRDGTVIAPALALPTNNVLVRHQTYMVTQPGGGWTQQEVNGLKLRIGYGTLAGGGGDPLFQSAALMVDVPQAYATLWVDAGTAIGTITPSETETIVDQATATETVAPSGGETLIDQGSVQATDSPSGKDAIADATATQATVTPAGADAPADAGTGGVTGAASGAESVQDAATTQATGTPTGGEQTVDQGAGTATFTPSGQDAPADGGTGGITSTQTAGEAIAEAAAAAAAASPSAAEKLIDQGTAVATLTPGELLEAIVDQAATLATISVSGIGVVVTTGSDAGTASALITVTAAELVLEAAALTVPVTPGGAETLIDQGALGSVVAFTAADARAETGTAALVATLAAIEAVSEAAAAQVIVAGVATEKTLEGAAAIATLLATAYEVITDQGSANATASATAVEMPMYVYAGTVTALVTPSGVIFQYVAPWGVAVGAFTATAIAAVTVDSTTGKATALAASIPTAAASDAAAPGADATISRNPDATGELTPG